MGVHDVVPLDGVGVQQFQRALLDDVRALDRLLTDGLIESGPTRIGAEQEMFLVDGRERPAAIAMQVLELAADPRLVTEIALFNLEANLTPRVFAGRCLSELHAELVELVELARRCARAHDGDVVLTGILPTLRHDDLDLDAMTPAPRYRALADAMARLRGEDFRIHIKGIDEIELVHPTVMLEAANTSFQLHWQVNPAAFARSYNLAQLITAPVLAACANSPLLFGQRLWDETRIALFQQSVDPRALLQKARQAPSRVGLGERWVERSVLELFREDIETHRPLIGGPQLPENSLAALARAEVPELATLRMHNGTVYRWNRPCYGVALGRAHLRIEFRAFPAGPTVDDEMATAALLYGLMARGTAIWDDPRHHLEFAAVQEGFSAAARHGLRASLPWIDGTVRSAQALLSEVLLPEAERGLRDAGIDPDDASRWLSIVAARVDSGQTGATWIRRSLSGMPQRGGQDERMRALVRAMRQHTDEGLPGHAWPLCTIGDADIAAGAAQCVGEIMTTRLLTVRENDLLDFADAMMRWRHVRHVPVEDERGHSIGVITAASLLRAVGERPVAELGVRDAVIPWPAHLERTTTLLRAMEMLRLHGVSALPVLDDGVLVGLVTERDLLRAAESVLRHGPHGGE